jgi:phage repressor protein C with HTH and peptisase S24 domain
VPYYDVDFCGGFDLVLNDQTCVPSGYINLPQFNDADSWANITGHSMEPLISNGDIIALHKIEDWHTYMLYGEVYGIATDEWRTVKRVRKSQNADYLLLESANKGYDNQEIPKSIVRGVWQVLGSVKKFF